MGLLNVVVFDACSMVVGEESVVTITPLVVGLFISLCFGGGDGDGEKLAEILELGETDADIDALGLIEELGESERLTELEGLKDALGDRLRDELELGDKEALGLRDADGDELAEGDKDAEAELADSLNVAITTAVLLAKPQDHDGLIAAAVV